MWCRLRRNRKKKALTVLDPSLRAFNGHHMEFAKIIKEECLSSFDVRFYANFEAETKILLSLPAQPICLYGIYPPPERDFDENYRDSSTRRPLARWKRSIGTTLALKRSSSCTP